MIRRPRNSQHGYLLIEALLALFVLVLMALLMAAALPISARSTQLGTDANAAQILVNRKLAQIQQAGYGKLNGPALGQDGDGIVDGVPLHPTATENAAGAQSVRFEFVKTDQVVTKLGVDATTGDARPEAAIFLAPYAPSAKTINGKVTYSLIRATAFVRWGDSRGQRHFTSGSTLIPKVKLNG